MKLKVFYAGAALLLGSYCMSAQGTTATDENKPDEAIITHQVQMGETVMLLARKYKTTPQEIYALNPDAVNGIGPAITLSIPAGKKPKQEKNKREFAFQAKPKEVIAHDSEE